jgi:hypothetical protein
MGTIEFKGDAPFEPLFALSASARATPTAIEVTVNVSIEGRPNETSPILILLEPEGVEQLASQLPGTRDQVRRWIKHPPSNWRG